ncbi:MAG: 1-deoxy-D-xylulose-5-phosphate synthase [Ignavibacteriales bacterium]|nr:1-deoxy-D-xylulose-5-phosphate synthase [Ignavibacteriales bacterium]
MSFRIIRKQEFDKARAAGGDWATRLELFAAMCRYNALVAVKKAGSGHLGSSFSAADIITYLYLEEMNVLDVGFDSDDRDVYFSSKGHDVPGFYSLLYALGVVSEEKLLMLRRLHGLDGHPEARIEGVESSTGSLGMGISKAKGFAIAKNYKKAGGRVFVMTGDGEWQEGQIFESLQAAAHQKVSNITAIIDHNKYQTDMLVKDVNNIEDIRAKAEAFGWHVQRVNGHDYAALRDSIKAADSDERPSLIIADTVKGKGVSFMEDPVTDASGRAYYKWHAGAPDDDHFYKGLVELRKTIVALAEKLGVEPIDAPEFEIEAKTSSKATKEFVAQHYGDALVELAKTHDRFMVMDGDLSADCKLRDFEYAYPDRFIENGIAEQDMASTAGGLALMGIVPVVNTFASFLAARANEQIYNNAGEGTKIIWTCHYAGLIPAGPGKSHQSVRDISLFGALPNVTIVQPCNGVEAKALTEYCVVEAKENCMMRLNIGPSPETIQLPDDYELKVGHGTALTDGDDALLVGYGPVMLHEALLASRYLKEVGFGLKVVNMPWLNRPNAEWLAETVKPYKNIFVVEDHSVVGGLGDWLLNSLNENDALGDRKFRKLGIYDYPECGTPWEVLDYHGLDGMSLAKTISGDDALDSKIDAGEVEKKYTADAPQ